MQTPLAIKEKNNTKIQTQVYKFSDFQNFSKGVTETKFNRLQPFVKHLLKRAYKCKHISPAEVPENTIPKTKASKELRPLF